MKKPKRSVVRIMVAVVAVGVGFVVVRTVFGCGTRAEAKMIAQFRSDPFFAAAPTDGTLVQDKSQPGTCDPSTATTREGGPGVTLVSRMYQTPNVYGYDELRLLFDRPAGAGGWAFETDSAESHPAGPDPYSVLIYCRQTGGQVFYADAQSPPPSDYMTGPGVLVSILHYPTNYTPCGQSRYPPAVEPAPTCRQTPHCAAKRDIGPLTAWDLP
jgi:hypothetical protein